MIFEGCLSLSNQEICSIRYMNVNCRHDQLIKQPYNQFEPFEPVLKHVTKMRDKSDYQMSCQKPYLGLSRWLMSHPQKCDKSSPMRPI